MASAPSPAPADEGFRVASYNIANPIYGDKFKESSAKAAYGLENWPSNRYKEVVHNIKSIGADIITLQECHPDTAEALKKDLTDYEVTYTSHRGRNDDGVAILTKKNRFAVQKAKEHHFQELDKNKKAVNRSSCYVDVFDNKNKKVIRVATGHIYGNPADPATSEKHASEFRKFAEQGDAKAGAPSTIILTADANAVKTSNVFKIIQDAGFRTDGNTSPTEPEKDRRIDFVFKKSTNKEDPLLARQAEVELKYEWASDHRPVVTDFIPASAAKKALEQQVKTLNPERLQKVFDACVARPESDKDDIAFIKEGLGTAQSAQKDKTSQEKASVEERAALDQAITSLFPNVAPKIQKGATHAAKKEFQAKASQVKQPHARLHEFSLEGMLKAFINIRQEINPAAFVTPPAKELGNFGALVMKHFRPSIHESPQTQSLLRNYMIEAIKAAKPHEANPQQYLKDLLQKFNETSLGKENEKSVLNAYRDAMMDQMKIDDAKQSVEATAKSPEPPKVVLSPLLENIRSSPKIYQNVKGLEDSDKPRIAKALVKALISASKKAGADGTKFLPALLRDYRDALTEAEFDKLTIKTLVMNARAAAKDAGLK